MANVIVDTDEGTLHVTQSGFDTNTSVDGDEAAGMRVTVVYEGGLTEVLTWQATGGTTGGVTGSGMSLTMSTAATFTLTSSLRVVSLKLEAQYGNAVFDTLKGVNNGTRGDTLGTKIGFPYEEMGGDPVTGTVAVSYSDGVIHAGLERGTDIFTTMTIDYSGVDGGGILGTIQFRSDMDNIAVPGDLAPVTANTAPDAVDDAITTNEDTAVDIAVRANDTDPDGDALTVQSVGQGAHGSVSINPDGSVRYDPNANYSGADSFTYTLSDGNGGTDTATVNVTVTPVNDAPVAVDDAASTAQGVPVDIAVLANDTDVDGDSRTVTSVTQGTNGSVAINPNGTVTYTPNAGFGGSDSFSYSISDGKGGTSSATVSVGVGSNAAPVAGDDAYSIDEDAVLTVAAPGVQANDTDANGDALTVSLVSGVSHGTLTLNANGSFTYTPSADYFGSDSFTYAVSDGRGGSDAATVGLTVNAVNDAPVANDDTASTTAGVPVQIAVLANDTDVEGQTLSVASTGQGTNGSVAVNADGTVTYSPNADFTGADSFVYTVSDGNGGTDTATVTVNVGSSGQVIFGTEGDDRLRGTSGDDIIDPLGGLRDEMWGEGGADFFDLASSSANGISEKKVILDFDFASGDRIGLGGASVANWVVRNGNLSITLDGDGDTINLRGVSTFDDAYFGGGRSNTAPVAGDNTAITNEDTPVSINVLANDTDADGDPLSVLAVTQGAHGVVSINPDGTLRYAPDANYHGADTFTYTVSDGFGGIDTATVGVTVTSVNDAPVANNDSASTEIGVPVDIDVAANDGDADGDPRTITAITQGLGGIVSINPNGTLHYAPNAGFDGIDGFTYTISDGKGGTSTASVSVAVAASGNVILGTEGDDRLRGTDGNDTFDPLGGARDEMSGGLGADFFDFASSVSNGASEKKVILDFDYDAGDRVGLGDASVDSWFVRNGNLVVELDHDHDVLTFRNFVDYDSDMFV